MGKFLKAAVAAIAVAFASTAAQAEIGIATGGEGGTYERLGMLIKQSITAQAAKKFPDLEVEVLNSSGSVENIELLNSGDATVAVIQADVLNVMKPNSRYRAKKAHRETVFWIYNKDHGIRDLSDLEGKKDYALVLVEGSGAQVTMQSFVAEDGGYKVNYDTAIWALDLYEAVDIVASGQWEGRKVAGALYVGGKIPNEIGADFSNRVGVGEATDGDFDGAKDINGEKLYQTCEISDGILSGLKTDTFFKSETVCVNAMVIYTTGGTDREMERLISKGVNKTLRNVH